MKVFTLSAAIALICASCATRDPRQIGGMDQGVRMLRHEMAFVSSGADRNTHLVATLKNTSARTMRVRVNVRMFCSTMTVQPESGRPYEIYEKTYLDSLCTSTWMDPVVEMDAGGIIRWEIPLGALVTTQGQPITRKSLAGSGITSELNVSGTKLTSNRARIGQDHNKPFPSIP